MLKVSIKNLEVGDRVYYVPNHLFPNMNNAELGFVTKIDLGNQRVWVKYKGPQGNLTPIENIYK
jgi:hypothetical protein